MEHASKAQDQLKLIYGDCTLGIRGRAGEKEFHYIFSYQTGGLESLCHGLPVHFRGYIRVRF